MHQGQQIWYYESGQKQWEANWEGGRKTSDETFWDESGRIKWTWKHNNDGTSIWTQYWPNSNKRSESSWYNFRAEGSAKRWDLSGNLISEKIFSSGRMQ
jgi:antitoxin component YwqK of YwqJK toxin-antitoxin module